MSYRDEMMASSNRLSVVDRDIAAAIAARADARIAELVDALDCLTLVVGLTAFKHESQRAPLQEAMDKARSAIAARAGGGESGE